MVRVGRKPSVSSEKAMCCSCWLQRGRFFLELLQKLPLSSKSIGAGCFLHLPKAIILSTSLFPQYAVQFSVIRILLAAVFTSPTRTVSQFVSSQTQPLSSGPPASSVSLFTLGLFTDDLSFHWLVSRALGVAVWNAYEDLTQSNFK